MHRSAVVALFAAAGLVSAAAAQPRIIQLPSGSAPRLSAGGGFLASNSFSSSGGLIRLQISPTIGFTQIPGSNQLIGISGNGQVLAGMLLNDGSNGFPADADIAGRWTGGVWSQVTPIPAATLAFNTVSTGYDLSADGRYIVGLAYSGTNLGFIFDAVTGESTPLEHPSGFGRTRANSVSGNGQVAGGNASIDGASDTMYATVWERNSVTGVWSAQFLDAVNNASVDAVPDISTDGSTAVGFVFGETAGTGGRIWRKAAGVWTGSSIPAPLTAPSGLPDPSWQLSSVEPTAVNGDGSVVVGTLTYRGEVFFDRFSTSFIWTQATGTRTLADHIVALGGPTVNDNDISGAQSISDDGLTIAGGSFFGGQWVVQLAGGGPVAPLIISQPDPTATLNLCDSIGLSVSVIGSGPFTYQWRRNGQPITDGPTPWGSEVFGATSPRLFFARRALQDAGTYDVVITSPGGAITSTPSVVTADTSIPTPANSTCAAAITMSEGTATAAICTNWTSDGSASCVEESVAAVWYRYVPSFTGNARIETCGSGYDSVLSVFSACGGAELACSDNVDLPPECNPNSNSRIRFLPVQAGVPVLVRVASSPFFFGGDGRLNLSISQAPARPANDLCQNAIPAVVGLNPFDTSEASAEGAVSECAFSTGPDVWYTFTAPSAGTVTISTCGGLTELNTVLSAYAECGGAETACSNDVFEGDCFFQSTLSNLPVQAGVPLLFRVTTTFGSGSGQFSLAFTPGAPCVADIVGIGGLPPADGSLTGDDFIAFINAFGSNNSLADIVGIGGQPPADGLITGDDFNAFIAAFASGCP
ncbi:MAG: GC-type dockerin domain-anchored protein [bacterium]